MIPIRLTFEAFGPFAKKQTIDFTRFDDSRIFLITGPTGSGKTTIFDAITFSLFGDTSGSTRSRNTLKSDFIGDTALCYTEFTFRVHGCEYTVRRVPAQTCPNARGTGTKAQAADAILSDENGVICSRVKEVDKKIEELLGLNYEQFRKIVLLPQGEFRRFLSDSSEVKQDILRRIFSTEILGRFTEQLKTRVSSLNTEYQHTRSQCDAYIETIRAEEESELHTLLLAQQRDMDAILSALHEQNEAQQKTHRETEEQLALARKEYESINTDLARQENELIEQKDRAEAEFAKMNLHNAEWSERKDTINNLLQIQPLAQKENEIVQSDALLSSLLQKQKRTEEEKDKQNHAFQSAQQAVLSAQAQHKDACSAAEQIPQLRELLNQLNTLSQTKQESDTLDQKIRKLEHQLKILAEAKLWLAEKTHLAELQKQISDREAFFALIPQYHKAAQEAADAANNTASALSTYIAAQAPFLAQNLRENEPCPVCGSTAHPHPASAHSHSGSKEAYESARSKEENAVRRRDALHNDLKNNLSEENRGSDPFACLQDETERLQTLRDNAAVLQTSIMRFSIPEALHNDSAEQLEQRISDKNALYQNACGRRDALSTQIAALEKAVPQDADAKTVNTRIIVLTADKDETAEILEGAQKNADKEKTELTRIETVLSETLQQIASTEKLRTEQKSAFDTLLSDSAFTQSEYETLRALLPELAERQNEFNRYKIEYRAKRDLVKKLQEQTAAMQYHDLAVLEAAKKDTKEKQDLLQAAYNTEDRLLHANLQAEQHLHTQSQKERKLREQYEQAHLLYGVARGDYSGRVNFERYVLAHYFENVIQNANIRLEQMTNSRYTLIRRTESESHNRASGLEMDVFDSYTGVSRHVDTLSGGESFKVALALALGLADIISESSGGIELNTMLIDEGFGSLDSDSLDAAINCLHDLQADGRYIGIISHVAELRERIPQRITIKPGVNGSTVSEETP